MKANGHVNGAGHRPRFPLVAFGQINMDTSRRYLIKNLIPREGLVVVWGPPKCGKSFLVSDISLHIALGWDYRNRRVEQGAVVYITCEGQSGFPARIEAFRQHRMGENEDPPPFYLLPTMLDLARDADELIHDITAQIPACSLIVLDTLNRSLNGSENKDEDMGAYILACDKLRSHFKCAVLVIHHCGIEGTRPRGHTSLSGALDTQIAVKRDESGNIHATVEYMKDGAEGAEFWSKLEAVTVGYDEDEEEITSCVIADLDQPAEPKPKADKPKRIPASAKVAANTLQTAIAQNGQSAPGSNHIPANKLVVTLDFWRRHHYLALGSDITPDAKRQNFHRSRDSLQGAGIIQIHGDYVWMV